MFIPLKAKGQRFNYSSEKGTGMKQLVPLRREIRWISTDFMLLRRIVDLKPH